MALPVVIREQIFIPINRVDEQAIIDRYTRKLYDDKACSKCDNLQDRHSDICDSCKSYDGEYKLYSHKLFGERQFIGLPIGDKALLPKITGYSFDEMKIYDKRTKAPFRHKIRLTCAPRPYQAKVIADFLRKKYGLIESPPRSGKTYMALNIGLKLGQRILFLADQHEFLTQFLDHVYGNEKEGIPRCTNVDELEEKLGYKIAGIPKKLEDFENFEIMAMTYQSFLSEVKGKKLMRLINRNVGIVQVDEVHSSGAREYSRVIQRLRAYYRMGVSGTIERKDGKHKFVKSIIGPVTARSTVEMLPVKFSLHDTEAKFRNVPKMWAYAMAALARHEKRNKLILDWVDKDLANGRSLVIPVATKKHMLELALAIAKKYGKDSVAMFHGGGSKKNKEQRKQILTDAKSGKVRVVIGIRRLLQRGLNVPRWDTLYLIMPISNEPNLKQETARIRTPGENKQPPLVRLFYDKDMPQSVGCARNTYHHMLGFKYEPIRSKATREGMAYFAKRPGKRHDDSVDPNDVGFERAMFQDDVSKVKSLFGR